MGIAIGFLSFFANIHAADLPAVTTGIKVEIPNIPVAWKHVGWVAVKNDIYIIYGGELRDPTGTAAQFSINLKFTAQGGYEIKQVAEKTFKRPVETYTKVGIAVSADLKESVPYTLVDGSEQTVSGSVHLVAVEIERDLDVVDDQWKPVTGFYAKALPGERINLRVKTSALPAGVKVDGFRWTLPDKVFSDYIATIKRGKRIDIDPEALKKQSIGFYFTTSGEKEILVNFDVDGATFQAATSINVAKPDSAFGTQKGVVRLGDALNIGHALAFLAENEPLFGVRYISQVTTPAGWPPGKFAYAQLIRFKRTYTNSPDGKTTVFGDGKTWMLDGGFPYGEDGAEFIADGKFHNDHGDSPSEATSIRRKTISIDESFQTHLMFQPAGAASRYVPLRKIDWKWGGKATAEDNWTKVTDPIAEVDEVAVETDLHPEWSANAKEAKESPTN